MEFPWFLFFYLGISKGFHAILQNSQGWKLVFSRICQGKVTNLKIPREGVGGWGSEKHIINPPILIFSGITHYEIKIWIHIFTCLRYWYWYKNPVFSMQSFISFIKLHILSYIKILFFLNKVNSYCVCNHRSVSLDKFIKKHHS